MRFEIELETLRAAAYQDLRRVWHWEVSPKAEAEESVRWVFRSGEQTGSMREVMDVAIAALAEVAAEHATSAAKELGR